MHVDEHELKGLSSNRGTSTLMRCATARGCSTTSSTSGSKPDHMAKSISRKLSRLPRRGVMA